jgi:ferredoxin, 2Fe-2S
MKVKFLPEGQELEIKPDQSVMELAHENGIFIKSVCNGLPSCAECRLKLVDGEQNVSAPSAKELNLIGTGYFIDQRRLSCQLRCFGDLVVDISEQVEKQKAAPKKVLGNRKMDMDQSHAVSAMLIDSEEKLKNQVGQDLAAKRDQGQRRPGGGGGGGNNKRRGHNNNNNRPRHQGNTNSGKAKPRN